MPRALLRRRSCGHSCLMRFLEYTIASAIDFVTKVSWDHTTHNFREKNYTPKMANEEAPKMLQQQQIPDLLPSMFYIPNFISENEEQRILEKVC